MSKSEDWVNQSLTVFALVDDQTLMQKIGVKKCNESQL